MHVLQKSRLRLMLILAISIVISVSNIGITRITNWSSLFSYPLLQFTEQCTDSIRTWHQKKQNIQQLEQQLISKATDVAQLQAEIVALKALYRESQLTTELRAFCTRYHPDQYIIGRIIKHVTTNDEQSIIVDIGTHHGVTPHMIVISHNCLIGYVEAVFPYHAKIITVADRRSKIPIQCINSGATGIYTGMNRSNEGELLFISHLSKLAADDLIVTSGDGFTYPAGFAVGKISTFSLDNQALHYTIKVELLHDIIKMTHIAVLKASTSLHDKIQE